MMSEEEKMFVQYWEANRDKEKSWLRFLLTGLPVGMLFGLPICILLFTGKYWYKRADMVANTRLDPIVLMFGVLLVVVFVAVFYRRHQWEMKEQQYQELKLKDDRRDERT